MQYKRDARRDGDDHDSQPAAARVHSEKHDMRVRRGDFSGKGHEGGVHDGEEAVVEPEGAREGSM